jgi:hypothetical protein
MRRYLGCYDSENGEIVVIDQRFKQLRHVTCWLLMHEMNHVHVGPEWDHNPVFDGGIFRLVT